MKTGRKCVETPTNRFDQSIPDIGRKTYAV